ncbi:hypothetical protein GCM10025869_13680 [Homoserinibacter gongjuensis]|uniref:Uncharacterized protein n=1 Tax=Homoserinibacter gongjuensis TaxID=1162968 RepID=A0ABQ6JS90_9MICO|nr:hypothetical protein GCM10025869_13680 [Homoserinibacter gongjuensis]
MRGPAGLHDLDRRDLGVEFDGELDPQLAPQTRLDRELVVDAVTANGPGHDEPHVRVGARVVEPAQQRDEADAVGRVLEGRDRLRGGAVDPHAPGARDTHIRHVDAVDGCRHLAAGPRPRLGGRPQRDRRVVQERLPAGGLVCTHPDDLHCSFPRCAEPDPVDSPGSPGNITPTI